MQLQSYSFYTRGLEIKMWSHMLVHCGWLTEQLRPDFLSICRSTRCFLPGSSELCRQSFCSAAPPWLSVNYIAATAGTIPLPLQPGSCYGNRHKQAPTDGEHVRHSGCQPFPCNKDAHCHRTISTKVADTEATDKNTRMLNNEAYFRFCGHAKANQLRVEREVGASAHILSAIVIMMVFLTFNHYSVGVVGFSVINHLSDNASLQLQYFKIVYTVFW